jgi:PKD repeat protein
MKRPVTTGFTFVLLALGLMLTRPATSQVSPSAVTSQVAPSQSAKEKALSQAAQSIAVPSAPVKITLTPNPPNPTTNQNVHFTVTCNQTGLLAKYYSFDWGDGKHSPAFQGSSNQPESDHSYSTPASYTVTATVRGICNDREIASSVGTVVTVSQRQDNPVPLPTPTLRLERPLHPQAGYPITLVADIDASVGPPEFHFYFGDGKDEESKTSNRIEHVYLDAGTYHPYVVAILGHGDAKEGSIPIDLVVSPGKEISEPPHRATQLTIVSLTQNPTAGNIVTVRASLNPPADAEYEFAWDNSQFEKGGESGITSHRFLLPGSHTARVKAFLKANPTSLTSKMSIAVAWSPLLVIALVGLMAVTTTAVVWLVRRPDGRHRDLPSPPAPFHVVAHLEASRNQISFAKQTGVYASLTLNPGRDPAEHRITFL